MSDEKRYKRIFLSTFTGIIVLLSAIALFVIIVDPYQQYRASNTYIGSQRLEIPGVARNHDYNAFVTGSSMAMNHYPEQIDSVFSDDDIPWKTKNFSIMGATWDDYDMLLRYVASIGKAKNIILDLDFFSFARARSASQPYLCNNSFFDDYKYWWNFTSLKNAIGKIRNHIPEKNLYHFDSPFGKDILKEDYETILSKGGYKAEDFSDLEELKRKFDANFIDVITSSPSDITWYIYFPPYSVYEFVVYEKTGTLDNILAFKKYMCNRLLDLENVRLYDFQCVPWITDTTQYMDLRHHSHDYNKAIIREMHADNYRVTPGSYLQAVDTLKALSNQYMNITL